MFRNVANVAYAHGMKSKTGFFSLILFSPHTRKQQLTTFDRALTWADRYRTELTPVRRRTKQQSTTFMNYTAWADVRKEVLGRKSPEAGGDRGARLAAPAPAGIVSEIRKWLVRLCFGLADQIGNLICPRLHGRHFIPQLRGTYVG